MASKTGRCSKTIVLFVDPTVWEYSSAKNRIDGDVREATERLVRKLHVPPNPTSKVRGINEEGIVDFFWTEFEDFWNQRGAFRNLSWFRVQVQGGNGR